MKTSLISEPASPSALTESGVPGFWMAVQAWPRAAQGGPYSVPSRRRASGGPGSEAELNVIVGFLRAHGSAKKITSEFSSATTTHFLLSLCGRRGPPKDRHPVRGTRETQNWHQIPGQGPHQLKTVCDSLGRPKGPGWPGRECVPAGHPGTGLLGAQAVRQLLLTNEIPERTRLTSEL